MDLTKFIQFLRTNLRFVITLSLIAMAVAFASSCRDLRGSKTNGSNILASFSPGISNLHFISNRNVRMPLPQYPNPAASSQLVRPSHQPRPQTLLSIHVGQPNPAEAPPVGPFSPYGRLLECVLVNAIDSGIPDSPVICLVVEDLWHNGELIVPAGTEVHGRAQVDRLRDRILVRGPWVLVWDNGEELMVSGVALNRVPGPNGEGWDITDGSAGLEGDLIRSQSLEEVKLFLATALSGVASGLQQQRTTTLGIGFIPGTARNAAIAGTTKVLDTYAQQVLETIKRDGVFIRVPSGKPLYVYVTETIDRGKAHMAGHRVIRIPEEAQTGSTGIAVPARPDPLNVQSPARFTVPQRRASN